METRTLTHRYRTGDVIEVTERPDGSFLLVNLVDGIEVKSQIEHHMTIDYIVDALALSGYHAQADPNVMTADEQRAVDAAIAALLPVRMRRPDGRVVAVEPGQVERRLTAGYTMA